MIVTHRSIIILTSAAESGASIFKMVEVSRHKSVDTLRGYVRRVDLFKEHAGAAFLCSCDPMEEIMPSARRHILYCQRCHTTGTVSFTDWQWAPDEWHLPSDGFRHAEGDPADDRFQCTRCQGEADCLSVDELLRYRLLRDRQPPLILDPISPRPDHDF